MQPGSHVHIISAGEGTHTAFPAVLRMLPGITRIYVIADNESYTLSQNPQIEKERAAIRSSVESVKEISASLSISFARETAFAPVFPSARRILTTIRRDNPNACVTFDLSGGPKALCMALFALAPYLGGEIWNSFDGKVPQRVPVPDRDIRGMLENVNYQTILAVLLRNRPVPAGPDIPFVPRQYLFKQVWPYYIRHRVRKPQPGDPVVTYRKGRKPANDLSQATFSWFMKMLADAGLIEESLDTRNKKDKAYRITENGETAFRFFAEPAVNSIVKQMLEGS